MIFGRDQGEAEDQPAGILKYVEDLRRGLNADIGRKDFFEMASRSKRLTNMATNTKICWELKLFYNMCSLGGDVFLDCSHLLSVMVAANHNNDSY